MEPLKFALSMAEAVAFLVVMVLVAIKISKANRPKSPCETCDYLLRKGRTSPGKRLYSCKIQGGFDNPPEYCGSYHEREDGGQDE